MNSALFKTAVLFMVIGAAAGVIFYKQYFRSNDVSVSPVQQPVVGTDNKLPAVLYFSRFT